MNTQKPGKIYYTCPQCGQGVRSRERLANHRARCLGTGQWRNPQKGSAS